MGLFRNFEKKKTALVRKPSNERLKPLILPSNETKQYVFLSRKITTSFIASMKHIPSENPDTAESKHELDVIPILARKVGLHPADKQLDCPFVIGSFEEKPIQSSEEVVVALSRTQNYPHP